MSAPTEPSIPARIGRYDVLLPIGTGGMATVYLARTEVVQGLHRFVAVKMMHPQIAAGDGAAAEQLIEEAKLAASIRHPNVVAVHEAAEGPAGVYMVMDYVEGDTLSGLIRRARAAHETLPLPIAARILGDALLGLHAAHELTDPSGRHVNLVHRDYSPSNILVGVDGVTRLADFGVAKAESRMSGTTTGVIKGKIGYMAPEQVLGKPLDRRCDVWAAGVVAWECLAGRRLHREEDQVATLFRIVQEAPAPLATVRPDLPAAIGAAIAAALTRDLDARCPTAAELRRRLLEACAAIGPVADVAEVGEYVKRLAGERLAAQRDKVARVLELRGQLARVSGTASALVSGVSGDFSPLSSQALASDVRADVPADPPTDAVPTNRLRTIPETREPRTERDALAAVTAIAPPSGEPARSPSTLATSGRGRRGAWRYALAAAGTAALLVSGRWLVLGDRGRGDAAVGSAAPPTASNASTSASVNKAPPEASAVPAAPPPAPAPAVVMVHGNAAIATLLVGQRAIAMTLPARDVEVRLADTERDGSLHIEAASVDGRRASAEVAPGASSASLVFTSAPRAPAAPARRPETAPHPPSRPAPPPLAPSPFGNQ